MVLKGVTVRSTSLPTSFASSRSISLFLIPTQLRAAQIESNRFQFVEKEREPKGSKKNSMEIRCIEFQKLINPLLESQLNKLYFVTNKLSQKSSGESSMMTHH